MFPVSEPDVWLLTRKDATDPHTVSKIYKGKNEKESTG